jgi:PAS domain-containing protein
MPPLYEHPIDRSSEPATTGNDAEADKLGSISRLADALQHERRRLDVITTILGGWVWETDADHRFVYLSPSVERHAGKPAEWHYGKTREELGEASLRHVDGRDWQEKLAAREPFGPVDFERYHGGRTLTVRNIGHPQFDAAGRFTGYCGVAFEIPETAEPKLEDRRASERRRMVRAAEVAIEGEALSISCVLIDASGSGARLRIPPDVALPARLHLRVVAMAIDTPCEVRWRNGRDIGVQFTD